MMILLSALEFSLPLKNPVIIFSLVLFIILFAPILLNKIKVPHIIGLIIAGVIIGPYGLNLLKRDSSIVLFGTVGLLYIMFLAGLEIDIAEFKKNRNKILFFGFTTFLLPLFFGTLASYFILGFSLMSSLLLASMFSTHTLVSYPIASKYGVIRNKSVAMTVGGTMIADILALLILAGVAGMSKEEATSAFWVQLTVSSIIFVCIVFFLFPIIIRWFFKKNEDSVSQYIFVLAMVFLASFLAEAAGIEAIIGAFFAGLVLNKFVPHSSQLMNRINFVGNALFIPFFLISVGMLVDISVIIKGWGALKVAGVIVVVALVSKYLAAFITQKTFRFTATEGKMIFGLSTSHAAATLAIILVGYNIIIGESITGEPVRLLNEDVLNGTILLILVSCGIGSFIVEKASKDLVLLQNDDSEPQNALSENILVSIGHQELVADLIDIGIMLKPAKSAVPIYGLHVIDDENNAETEKRNGKKILDKAEQHAIASGHTIVPIIRYDSSISNGIIYSIREHNITDVVIGLHKDANPKKFLGEKGESITKRIFEQIYIYKPVQPLNTLKRIVAVAPPNAEKEAGFIHWLNKLFLIGKENALELIYYAHPTTMAFIKNIAQKNHNQLTLSFKEFSNWDDFLILSREIRPNDLFIIISSRKGGNSYVPQLTKLPYYLSHYFNANSFILIYPKQIEAGINMGDIQQADSGLIETLTEQIGSITKVGKYLKKTFGNK